MCLKHRNSCICKCPLFSISGKKSGTIKQTVENLEINGDIVTDHIIATGDVVKRNQGGGSVQLDYRLTRYA
jgi:hypothetical protein